MATLNVMSLVMRRRSATAERRTTSRLSHVASARVTPPHATGYFAGYATTAAGAKIQIHNLSRGGIGFTCSQLLDSGKSYAMELGSGWMHTASGIRVVWCRERVGSGGYEGGGEFY